MNTINKAKYSVEVTPDVQLNRNILVRIMREQGISLLQAHQQMISVLDDAVTYTREQWENGELK